MTDPKLIEAVARAIAAVEGQTEADWKLYQPAATAVLSAIDASGTHWVAPVEATDQMREAMLDQPHGASSAEIWHAMRTAFLAEKEEKP